MDYTEALDYLDNLTNYEKKTDYAYSSANFDLRRPRELLSLMGDPHLQYPAILVAGTKGKGSTSIMVASILQASGRRVGFYSQPHFHTFRERIRVDDRLIAPEDFASAVEAVIPAMNWLRLHRPDLGMPTSYEVATAAALHYFAKRAPDVVVLEVGLGGRLDATNVVNPLVSVITPISLDHVQILGDTLAQIAFEKAGIIKGNGVVVSAEQPEEAMDVIRRVAVERSARLVVVHPQIVENAGAQGQPETLGDGEPARPRWERTSVVLRGGSGDLYRVEIPLLGAHQVANAATAISVVEELVGKGIAVDRRAVERGLYQIRWPGRLEVVFRCPLVVVDGAHNGDSARKLAAALRENFLYRHLILVLGTSSDKDIEGIVDALAPKASTVIATRSHHARAAYPERLAAEARERCLQVEVSPDIPSALGRAMALATPSDLICATGSLYTVADARAFFGLAVEED